MFLFCFPQELHVIMAWARVDDVIALTTGIVKRGQKNAFLCSSPKVEGVKALTTGTVKRGQTTPFCVPLLRWRASQPSPQALSSEDKHRLFVFLS